LWYSYYNQSGGWIVIDPNLPRSSIVTRVVRRPSDMARYSAY
jgi:hypothetical protein